MEIKKYNKSQLNEFIASTEFMSMDTQPITRHRALSHIHNPYADENDPLLFVIWEEKKMIAYAGVLADEITIGEKKEKCGWFSLFWVNDEYRGKGIGKKLILEVIESWNEKLLVADFVPSTKVIYEKTKKFNELKAGDGLRCFINFNLHDILPPKNVFFKWIRPLLSFTDLLLNLATRIRFIFYRHQKNTLEIEEIKYAEEKHNPVIEKYNKSNFRKTATHLNWILSFPWILSPINETEKKKFYFSSYESFFSARLYEIKREGKLVGLMMLTLRNGHLKVPFCFCHPDEAPGIAQFLAELMRKTNMNMITVFHPEIMQELKKIKIVFVSKRNFKRHYLASKYFDTAKIRLNDGDGDCGFT